MQPTCTKRHEHSWKIINTALVNWTVPKWSILMECSTCGEVKTKLEYAA